MTTPSILDPRKQVDIAYTSKEGRRFIRRIQPIEGQLFYNYNLGSMPEYLIRAIDVSGDGTLKWFTLKDIALWRPLPTAPPYPPMPMHPAK